MKKDQSFQQNTKALVLYKEQHAKISVVEMYAQMILDELEYNHRVEQLKVAIDKSLDCRDEALFLSLSEEYRKLVS
ncbi:IDEAL domain-containing protein [Terrilactibacillus sp. BCM23-1]|uniref:IDEAL domain-containing protein n=1 Tax=Terrilactibacillus tamarindi TaxID=2599694 RepID=A0A6N8CSU3_9BACI|nr:IDEAL domain-containing protein [Terrilactibacillus tamarindi]MTT33121.1 IDEAL domain-containing protein [Terrilactibacillus tamarindi]